MLAAGLGLLVSAWLALPEDVELKTEDGVKIAASYTKPEGEGKRPALILVHMLGRKKEDWADFASAAAKAGYAVGAIDMRGHGKSENPQVTSIDKWGGDEWMGVLKDIKAAKAFLSGKEEVDAKKIVLVGASIGANLSLQYAANDADIRAVAVLSPGDEYRGVSSIEPMDKYVDRPFFGAASEDDPKAAECVKSLAEKATSKVKAAPIYKKAGHGTNMFGHEDNPGELTTALIEWLKEAAK